ncbi:MAG: site-specific integrase [Candidatus Bathyarchaeota archaeon]|nr:MAG: site-specific integrase [Candidatus Bathyarchaeota archaeon]
METVQPTFHEPQELIRAVNQRTVFSGNFQSSQLIIKPKQLTKQDITELNQFGKIQDNEFILEKSGRGYTLKNPVKIPLGNIYKVSSKGLIRYVIASLSQERPKLVPYVFQNKSILKLANYLLRYRTGSPKTLYLYVDCIWRYTNRANLNPDQLISDVKDQNRLPKQHRIPYHIKALEDYVCELQDNGLAPSRISNYVKAIRALYRVNGIDIKLPQPISRRTVKRDRAPKPEELHHVLDIADLRERVIVSMLALGGFREGTLVKLKYKHVREDLEKGIVPLHIHIEAAITKGKYNDYDTFIGKEAAVYLREYIETRRLGSPDGKIPPEILSDDSPLIRNENNSEPKTVGGKQIYKLVHNLYFKAGLLKPGYGGSYTLKVHSIRKFFKTQLLSLGVQPDYVDYMMGHTIDVYHDIQMKGIDYLRNIYAASGLSIAPKTQTSKIDALKEIIRAWGLNPEEILTREAMTTPHRTVICQQNQENKQMKILCDALKAEMKKELTTQ